ncbi:MAG: GxxExxY protein [bacterium]|nr:GxxExxY protein [bacterium]
MEDFIYKDLTEKIIGAAMEVHRILGPGFLESIYENAMAYELAQKNVNIERQKQIIVKYKNSLVGEHFLDALAENAVVIEYKAVKDLDTVHEAQVISYLKATGYKVGLLFNFSKESLEFKRIRLKESFIQKKYFNSVKSV